jgi:hypothetical protein
MSNIHPWHPKKFTWHAKRFSYMTKGYHTCQTFTTDMPKGIQLTCQKIILHVKRFPLTSQTFTTDIQKSLPDMPKGFGKKFGSPKLKRF